MPGLQRSNVAGDDFLCDKVVLAGMQHAGNDPQSYSSYNQDCGSDCDPFERRPAPRHAHRDDRTAANLVRYRPRFPAGGNNPAAQPLRRAPVEIAAADCLPQGLLVSQFLSTFRACLQVLLEFKAADEIEFAIGVGVEQELVAFTSHGAPPCRVREAATRAIAHARARGST